MDTASAATPVTDEEIQFTSPTGVIRLTAGAQIFSSVINALVAVQYALGVNYHGVFQAVPYVILLSSIVGVPLGANVYRMRGWAARSSCATAGVLAVVSSVMFVLNLIAGIVSCLGFIAPPLAIAAFVLSFFAIGPCVRADAIRLRMRAQGLDLGR